MLGKCHAQQQFHPSIHPFGMGSLSYPSSCLHGMLCICTIMLLCTMAFRLRLMCVSFANLALISNSIPRICVISYIFSWAVCELSPSFPCTFREVQIHCHFLSKSLVGNKTPEIRLLSNRIGIVAPRIGCVHLAVGMRHSHSFHRMNEWSNVCLLCVFNWIAQDNSTGRSLRAFNFVWLPHSHFHVHMSTSLCLYVLWLRSLMVVSLSQPRYLFSAHSILCHLS